MSWNEVIRQTRNGKGMTLKEVADMTGLSTSFLSELENGKVNPTISTLRKISSALGVSLFSILRNENPKDSEVIVRANKRKIIRSPEYNIEYELVSNLVPHAKSELVLTWLDPSGSTTDEPTSHGASDDEEITLVLEGTVEVTLEQRIYILEKGDSIRFSPAVRHRYRNCGDVRARFLCVMTPPSF